jgi:tagaturonate reductase
LIDYAENVLLRFENPFIRHKLADISLNSVSKFKVRVLPSILAYRDKFGYYPKKLMFSFRQLLLFYKTNIPNDDPNLISFMKDHDTREILANESLWGMDLSHLTEELQYDYTP